MILGENGEKMSKSRGNVVNPDDIVEQYGADTMRLYEMFIGDFEKAAPWSSASIKGCKRFLERVWSLQDAVNDGTGYSARLESSIHRTIKKVTDDIDAMKFNTAIAALMSLINEIGNETVTKEDLRTFILLLSPFAPHISEEIYESLGFEGTVNSCKWPEYDESKCVLNSIEIVVQINGKVRARLSISPDADNDAVIALAKQNEKIAEAISGKQIVKELYVKGKLVNIVVR